MISIVMRRLVASMALLAFGAALAFGGAARAETPTPADHNAHHAAATPAMDACAALAAGTPMSGGMTHDGMMAGTPMAGMEMPQEFDLMFIDMMTVHHQGAMAMARVALERAEHEEVRELAQAIIDAQQAEMEQLREWRDAWYPGAPAMPMDRMSGMMGEMTQAMPDMMGTPGAGMGSMMMMDPQAEAQALCNASGPFDQAFLQMMIPHHQSAIAMAQVALQQAAHPEIKELAQEIIDTQQAEVAEMQAWLAAWYGTGTGPATPAAATGIPVAVTQGEMFIEAERTTFQAGETYVFTVTNEGQIPHDFVIEAVGAAHDHETGHEDAPNMLLNVQPGQTETLVWSLDEPGDYELTCRLPAHYEAGMVLPITVTQ